MKCPNCSAANPDGALFCGQCRSSLDLHCTDCGKQISREVNFCRNCAAPNSHYRPHEVPKSPKDYTPQHLADKIFSTRSMSSVRTEAVQRDATVLFADIKGSTALIEELSPHEARELLAPALKLMVEAVSRYEGFVTKLNGDGITGVFGAPIALEEHALRACCAALAIHDAIRTYNEGIRRTYGIDVQLRIGLNSGEVLIAPVADDLQTDLWGLTVHIAARMEQTASPGTTRLTAASYQQAERALHVKALGAIPVKGVTAPVEVFELTGASTVRRARHDTPFVGRERELATLRRASQNVAANGRLQVVGIAGDPGVGKSRLFYEFARTLGPAWMVLESVSVSHGKALPFHPVRALLKSYFGIDPQDDDRRLREKITGRLVNLDVSLLSAVPVFTALLDVEQPDWSVVESPKKHQSTIEALKRLLLRESNNQPICLIFEDLHWIDTDTQAFLDGIVGGLVGARILLLVNYRLGYQHTWIGKTYYTHEHIQPFSNDEALTFLHQLIGTTPETASLKGMLIDRSEGNALFLEESVRNLVESRVLEGSRGSYRLLHAVNTISVPRRVQTILNARIDKLPRDDQHVLGMAAVIGKHFSLALLRETLNLEEDDLLGSLDHLQSGEFIYQTTLYPDIEYTFKHAVTHQVASGRWQARELKDAHQSIVIALERLYSDHMTEYADRLAHHAMSGGLWEKSVKYSQLAGSKAMALLSSQQAEKHYRDALECLAKLPTTADRIAENVAIRINLRHVLLSLGKIAEIGDVLHEAEQMASTLNDPQPSARVNAFLSSYASMTGDHIGAIERGLKALDTVQEFPDDSIAIVANMYIGLAHYGRGEYIPALTFLGKNIDLIGRNRANEHFGLPGLPSVVSRAMMAMCFAETADFSRGLDIAQAALKIAQAANAPYSLISAYLAFSIVSLRRGDFTEALRQLERSRDLYTAEGFPLAFAFFRSLLVYVKARLGQLAGIEDMLKDALQELPSLGDEGFMAAQVCMFLGEACLLGGFYDDGRTVASKGLEISRKHEERGLEAHSLRLLSEISLRAPARDLKAAEITCREALASATKLGMRGLVAHSQYLLGLILADGGRTEPARSELATAYATFDDLGMTFWREQAQGALSSLVSN